MFFKFTYQETIHFSHVVYKTKDRLPGHISPAGTSAIEARASDVIGKAR